MDRVVGQKGGIELHVVLSETCKLGNWLELDDHVGVGGRDSLAHFETEEVS